MAAILIVDDEEGIRGFLADAGGRRLRDHAGTRWRGSVGAHPRSVDTAVEAMKMGGNRRKAAERPGLGERTLYETLQRYGIG